MTISVNSKKKQVKKSFDELLSDLRTNNSEKVNFLRQKQKMETVSLVFWWLLCTFDATKDEKRIFGIITLGGVYHPVSRHLPDSR